MRSKTFVLGILAILLLVPFLVSGREISDQPDFGLNAGEMMPSIKVEGVDWFRYDTGMDSAVLVVWSKNDAVSRVVNAWISRQSESDMNVYSICIDADQKDAELYARADNVNPNTKILGAWNSKKLKQNLRELAKAGSNSVFFTDNGVIQAVKSTSELWQEIQTSDPSSKI